MTPYFKGMRLERWPRSLAIFVGCAAFFFIHYSLFSSINIIWLTSQLVFSFLLTWAISTANYIINEIVDAPYDAHHPTKRNRPLVKGDIQKKPFLFLGIMIMIISLALAAFFFSRPFFLSLLALLVAGFIYNIKPLRTKDIPFLDSISESINNPIRFLIGWFALSPTHFFPPV
ncbi:UbiA family prenyltransferase, partial [Acidobacteriota bacterium]